jgi:hypothetical protein
MRMRLLSLVGMGLLACGFAHAQASRTWVSGVGDDANPCSRTAPCKTFAGAISKTAPGGEIDALDPAGYGALTITKAITVDGGGGQVASVLVSGTNGIVVNAGVNDTVILRNIRINGLGTGLHGIDYKAGKKLIVENVDVFGFSINGIWEEPTNTNGQLIVTNTNASNNASAGIRVEAGRASIDSSNLSGNLYGLVVFTGRVTAVDTVAGQNRNRGFHAGSGQMNLTNCSALHNDLMGVSSDGAAVVRIAQTTITGNGTGISATNGGQVISWGNNFNSGNNTNGAPTTNTPPQ